MRNACPVDASPERGSAWRIAKSRAFLRILRSCDDCAVRDLTVLVLHLLTTIARLAGPGGARSVVAESVLVKHQLLILTRSRKRSPNLRPSDRAMAGLCALFMRPGRFIRSAIVFKPSTLLSLHRALIQRKYRRLFSSSKGSLKWPQGTEPGPHRRRRRHATAEPDLGMPTDRATDHPGLRYSHA
jgi:hypothetical protein